MDSGAIGNLALWGAVAASGLALLAGAAAGRAAPRHRNRSAARCASAAGRTTVGLATVAVGALAWSLLSGNFALAYVVDTTTRQGSWAYRLAGLWGGNGGSLLLWAWVILLAGWAASRPRRRPGGGPDRGVTDGARTVATVAGGAVLLVAAAAANPFQRLAVPAIGGGGLSPILRYPAMLYHPPLLYAGHAGLAAPFALAAAGLATGRLDRGWLASTRRWMLAAWLLLGIGLVSGAHWSYVELGWGGFWAWDPVENGGLLPLLAATVFLHHARHAATTDDGRHAPGLAGLAALPFALSLLGATLSRSGAAQSVHAFAQAGAVGRGLLAVLAAAVAATIGLVARARRRAAVPRLAVPAAHNRDTRTPARAGGPSRAVPLRSQDAALVGAVIVLLAMALVVVIGTAFPALLHSVTGDRVAVTTRYYALVLTPLVAVLLVLMGAGPSLPMAGRPSVPALHPRRNGVVAAVAVAAGVGGFVGFAGPRHMVPGTVAGAAAFALVLTLAELLRANGRRRVGALLAHAGVALLLLGVAGSLRGGHETQVLRLGATMRVDGFSLRYRDVATDEGTGWRRVTVIVDVSRAGRRVAVLRPGLRVFDNQTAALSDVALQSTPARDVIVAVRQVDPASRAAELETTVRPLVTLVWWGGLLAAAGGLTVLAGGLGATRPTRHRPTRHRPTRHRPAGLPAATPGPKPAPTPAPTLL